MKFEDMATSKIGKIGHVAVYEYLKFMYQPPPGTRKDIEDVSDAKAFPEYKGENVDIIERLYDKKSGVLVKEVWHEVKTDRNLLMRKPIRGKTDHERDRMEKIHDQIGPALSQEKVTLDEMYGTGNIVIELEQERMTGWYNTYKNKRRKDMERYFWYYIISDAKGLYGEQPYQNNLMLRVPFHELAEVFERNEDKYEEITVAGKKSRLKLMPLEDIWRMPRNERWEIRLNDIMESYSEDIFIQQMPIQTDPSTGTTAKMYIDQDRKVEAEEAYQKREKGV